MNLQPYDYTLKGIQDPGDSFMAGMKQTFDIQGMQAAREEAKLKQAQALRAQAQQEAINAEMAKLAGNPTVEGIWSFVLRNPSFAKNYDPILSSLTAEKKANYIKRAGAVFAALNNGRPDLAISELGTQIEAARNSGKEEEARHLELQKKMLESRSTGQAGNNIVNLSDGLFLAIADPDNFAKNYGGIVTTQAEQAEAPAKLSKAQADAMLAQKNAEYGPDKQTIVGNGFVYVRNEKGEFVNTGLKASAPGGVNISLGTPQFAVEEATGQQVIYQPSPTGAAKIIRGLRPVTEQTKESGKETAKFNKLANVIDIAKKTLEKASGSYAGAIGAGAQRAVGISSETTKANAKLKALQAAMMMNMPRMEGPQSDKDVQLYREQAGQLGDPTIPVEDRLAALDVLAEIMDRYKSGKAAPEKPKAGFNSVDDLMSALGKK